jgi:hypothetical protein
MYYRPVIRQYSYILRCMHCREIKIRIVCIYVYVCMHVCICIYIYISTVWNVMLLQGRGFPPQYHHMSLMDFVVSPPGCGRNVTDFWGWDAHEVQLRCLDKVDGDIWIWSTGRGLNLSYTKLPRPWSPWESSPSRKNPHGRTGNRTGDLMISSQKLWPLDHEAGRFL